MPWMLMCLPLFDDLTREVLHSIPPAASKTFVSRMKKSADTKTVKAPLCMQEVISWKP